MAEEQEQGHEHESRHGAQELAQGGAVVDPNEGTESRHGAQELGAYTAAVDADLERAEPERAERERARPREGSSNPSVQAALAAREERLRERVQEGRTPGEIGQRTVRVFRLDDGTVLGSAGELMTELGRWLRGSPVRDSTFRVSVQEMSAAEYRERERERGA